MNEIAASLFLLVGVIDDLKTRKIHNQLVIGVAVAAVLCSWLFRGGWPGVQSGMLACGAAIALTLPLVLSRVLGAGDMKLLMAFSLAVDWNTVLWLVMASLVWGTLLGLTRATLRGELGALLKSTALIAARKKTLNDGVHAIPYSVALFMGWLTCLTLQKTGGLWW